MNINNLKLLRDGLKKLMDDGVVTQETFDMKHYRSNERGKSIAGSYSLKNCGTIGCLMGRAPFVEGLEFNETLTWTGYVSQKFNTNHDTDHEFDEVFVFLFSSKWSEYDNTPEGALARLDVFLAGDFKYKDEDKKND